MIRTPHIGTLLAYRLLATGVDERIRHDLLGHALKREQYGSGATLEHMQELVLKVAL
jgi:hypothetical protein